MVGKAADVAGVDRSVGAGTPPTAAAAATAWSTGTGERVVPLDGLRGLAITAVVLFHAGVAPARGGFLGVDLFFVLSGFLITSLLLADPYRVRRFWSRRARRLLPPVIAVVVVVTASAALFGSAADRAQLSADGLSALGYFSNWRFALSGRGYFDQTALPSPLLHTWSLSIEEQFYLVWPLLVALACRSRWGGRALVAGAALLAVGSYALAYALYGGEGGSARAYYGTDTRMHALLAGATLAGVLYGRRRSTAGEPGPPLSRPGLADLAGAAGLAITVVLWVTIDGQRSWLGPLGPVIVDLAAVAVIAAIAVHPRGVVGRLLSAPPLVGLGLISYSLYVWHWPIDLFLTSARTGLSGTALLAVRLVAAVLAGTVSWRCIERPFRAGGLRTRPAVTAAGVAVAAVLVLCLPAVVAPPSPEEPALAAAAGPVASTEPVASTAPSRPSTAPPAAVGIPTTAAPDPNRPLRAVIFGDSVARSLALPIAGMGAERQIELINEAVLGCGVARGGPYRYFGNTLDPTDFCEQWPERWRAAVAAHRPDVVVVLVGRFEVMDRTRDGDFTNIGEPAYDSYLAGELERAVDVVSELGARVVVSTAPYYKRGERPDGGLWPEDETWRVDRFNTIVREVVARSGDRVSLVDIGAALGPDGGYSSTVAGIKVRYDGVHLTTSGARMVAPLLFDAIRSAVAEP